MNRKWVRAILPPAVVAAIVVLLAPSGHITAAAVVALVALGIVYLVHVLFPLTAPDGRSRAVFVGSYALLVIPFLVATIVIATIALAVPEVSWEIVLPVEVVILGVLFVRAASAGALTARDARLEKKTKQQVDDFRTMATNVRFAVETLKDTDLNERARLVSEQLRLSPFAGTNASAPLEYDLAGLVYELQTAVIDDRHGVPPILDRISVMVTQRNEIVRNTR